MIALTMFGYVLGYLFLGMCSVQLLANIGFVSDSDRDQPPFVVIFSLMWIIIVPIILIYHLSKFICNPATYKFKIKIERKGNTNKRTHRKRAA